jgi:hypothetical protein
MKTWVSFLLLGETLFALAEMATKPPIYIAALSFSALLIPFLFRKPSKSTWSVKAL